MSDLLSTPEALWGLVGLAVSVLFTYVPSLNTWYASQSDSYKRLFMLGVLAGLALLAVLISCVPIGGSPLFVLVPCTRDGLTSFLVVFLSALVANQAAHSIFPKPNAVKLAVLLSSFKNIPEKNGAVGLGRGGLSDLDDDDE